jgi:hypothetical protein
MLSNCVGRISAADQADVRRQRPSDHRRGQRRTPAGRPGGAGHHRRPTLLVAAEHSPEAFRQVTDAIADAIPNSRTFIVQGGHLINPADPPVTRRDRSWPLPSAAYRHRVYPACTARLDQGGQGKRIPAKRLLRERGPLPLRERQGAARRRVLREPRQQMSMQVRHGVAEGLVVHLHRLVVTLEGRGHLEDLQPVPAGFLHLQLGWLGDVAAAPDDDGVAELPAGALRIGVAVAAGMDADAVVVLVGAVLGTSNSRCHAGVPTSPTARSCSCCTSHAAGTPIARSLQAAASPPAP